MSTKNLNGTDCLECGLFTIGNVIGDVFNY
jgi:hypothetical protein